MKQEKAVSGSYSQSLVIRNSSKEPESGPSPRDVNELRKTLRHLVNVMNFSKEFQTSGKK